MNRGNKMWEGHRIILPEARGKMIAKEPELIKRQLTEEELERFDKRIHYAKQLNKPLLITFFGGNMLQECIAFSFWTTSDALGFYSGRQQKLIPRADIVDIAVL